MSQTLACVLAGSICLHNLEEFVFLPGWRRRHTSVLPPIEPIAFRIAALLVTAFPSALLALTILSPGGPWVVILAGFGGVMASNALVPHLALSLSTTSYMPGTATGLGLVLPSGVALIVWLLQNDQAEFFELAAWAAATGLGAAGVVVLTAKATHRPWSN